MAPDWTNILFAAVGVAGVVVLVSAQRRARGRQALPDPVSLRRRRIGGAGAVCVGILGGLLLVEQYAPDGWHGVLVGLLAAGLVVLMGLVVAALVLAVRAERLASVDRS
ncbi:hypothetical protein [Pseudonocardia humida]|uniref:Secreted protein with PEP-CTERM sorting signal n=1 Tax=Pseudonocardia humida TaxID=2800819 RepID=A0ABT0ZZ17_9PSEU|nr:hypothetical protein [Pseudonocardia humida]MCO1655992.1 hypothetical protein [Pseudonocardia humida]